MPSFHDPNRVLVFCHIPKTSGMSLTHALIESTSASRVIYGFDAHLFGDFDNFESFNPELRSLVVPKPRAIESDPDLVVGHFAASTTIEAFPGAQHATVLREPTIRLLSHWLYWRSFDDAEIRRWGGYGDRVKLARGSLYAFIIDNGVASQTDNLAIRALLWPHPLIPTCGFISRADDKVLLEHALSRIASFEFADFVENPDFDANVRRWLRRDFNRHRENESQQSPNGADLALVDHLDASTLSALEDRTRLDRELWLAVAKAQIGADQALSLGRSQLIYGIARYSALLGQPGI
jgi:hypothetical protein